MNKSLGDYNIEKSSSHNIKNIVWTKKKSPNTEKLNKKSPSYKKSQKNSYKNIVYSINPKSKSDIKKIFKIEEILDTEKLNKKNNLYKKFQKSSASNCNIKQGFKRPGR